MAITGFHHLVIRVEDLDASVETWQNLLGIRLDRTDVNDALGTKQFVHPKTANGVLLQLAKA